MKQHRYLNTFLFGLIGILITTISYAQISITFPTTRIVFQRDNGGNGVIPITGHFGQNIDRVEARVLPMGPGQGQQTDWTLLQQNPQGGFYSGSLTVRGGWYEVQVRGLLGGNTVTTTEIQRIGVGEVFLVAGQSNAQGFFNYGAPGSGDDRVNCVNYRNVTDQNGSFPPPNFVKLGETSEIGPRGLSAWCWGRLGDMIASRYNVPVLFYNAGWEGTLSKNWVESMDGGTSASMYAANTFYAAGQPYGNLRMALNYYAATTGLRAVLWHQGEADNLFNISTETYRSNLQAIINKSRQHFGKNVAWVVARTSYYNSKGSNPAIINGQNQVVQTTPSVFYGPSTDGIQNPRPDGVHFQSFGINDVANAWNASLDDGFFINSSPQTGNYPSFAVNCVTGNQLNVQVNGPFASVQWNNGANGASVNFGPGTYQATVRDGAGNVFYGPAVTVPNDLQNAPVNISIVDGKLPLCVGSSVTLSSSNATNNVWSNGSTNQRIEVTTAGNYTVATKNQYGCNASASINVTTFQAPPPAKPTITASGATTFCQGGEVTFTSNSAAEYRWSTGERGQSITVRDGGSYQLRVLDAQGCQSEVNSVSVQVNMPPAAPTIVASGGTTFCEGGRVNLSSNYNTGNRWSTNEEGKEITVTRSGTYNVRFRDANGCDAISNNITVTVNPLPAAPTITREKPEVFCDGDSTVLLSSPSFIYNWSNGANTRRISSKTNGTLSLTVTDQNGCTSPLSATVTVRVNPLPAAPAITADRNPSICENEVVTLTSNAQQGYVWSNGQNTRSITVNFGGRYSARTVDNNGCFSPSSNVLNVVVNRLPAKPIITPDGPTTFCQGLRVTLTTNYDTGLNWNNFQTTKSITANAAGEYRVRYRDANGCESLSDPTTITLLPLPPAPTVVNERPTTFCLLDNTILTITSAGNIFNWSTGESGRSIKTFSAGEVSATVFEPSTGCTSLPSTPIKITVNPLPPKPTITASGPTTICADQSVTLTAPESSIYEWSHQVNTRATVINRAGTYTVFVRNQFGCISEQSDPVSVRVNPLPPAPTVIAEGRTTFCDGDQVGLRVENLNEVIWNTNETTKRIIVRQSGNYAARVKDGNGCLSPFSGLVRIDAKPLPITPVIQKTGIYTLAVTNINANTNYNWTLNGNAVINNSAVIKTNQAGNYNAQAFVQFSPTLTCFSRGSLPLAYQLDPTGDGFGIYPNPSRDGLVTVETLEDLTNVTVEVFEQTGKLIFTGLVPTLNAQARLDLRHLPPATYIVRVSNNIFNKSKKIVINP
ncbi:MAG: T9SS type A sorting domain-containing protein [Spirosomaceae bacterium]|nr:T9SS type A sorting domain-containing protein [Spirosomataceae bacterium]